ncbi:MAG: ABC transporter permease [Miniphocaeibacter sp.]|uniref:ABC transporter permease n=1 Tax=Miniphocaeibacter sp. TaxID=3100973 RepID=UPI001792B153|nr:hypothetical protein [Gallicola sp.]
MNISIRKISAIAGLKLKIFSRNTYYIMSPFLVILLGLIFGYFFKGAVPGYSFIMTVGFNISMVGISLTAAMVAEEKEKHTLRALMTSSITGGDYLLGSALIPFLVMLITALVTPLVTQFSYSNINIPMYLLLNIIGIISMILIGFIFGIFGKSQAHVSTTTMPIIMVLVMLPTFSMFSEFIGKISMLTISGVMDSYLNGMIENINYALSTKDWIVLAAWVIIPAIIFIYVYRKNGIDE